MSKMYSSRTSESSTIPEDDQPVVSETTALLASTDTPNATRADTQTQQVNNESANLSDSSDEERPFEVKQVLLLCYARLFEAIAFFTIFPFINQMVWETGSVQKSEVGYYSGLVESLLSLVQMFFMIPAGRLSDHPKVGRKPVLVVSLVGLALSTAVFGMSRTIWQMIVLRCCGGIFAGTVVTIRVLVSENSNPETRARAFSFYAFAGNLGIFLGPFLGGVTADPARLYPRVFGHIQFFKQYRYALPTFVTGIIGLSAALITGIFVKETLTTKILKNKSSEEDESRMSTWELLKAPGVAFVIYLYAHAVLLGFIYTAIIALFWFTPVELGGCGFSPFMISIFFGVCGGAQAIWGLLAFPWLQRRYGTGGVLHGCGIAYPFVFLTWPFCNLLLRLNWKVAFWIVAPLNNVLGVGVSMAFTAAQLALNDISPSSRYLGTLNALALTNNSFVRAVTPALFSTIFAWGVSKQILGGYLGWVVSTFFAASFGVVVRYLPEKAEGRIDKNRHDPGDDGGTDRSDP